MVTVLGCLMVGCGGGQNTAAQREPTPIWQGGSASLQLQVFASYSAGTLSDPPLAHFNYLVVPTPNVAIENWLATLRALSPQAARCVSEGPIHVLSFNEGHQQTHFVDENHAACLLTGVPAGAHGITTEDMQSLQRLLVSYEQDQAQRVAEAQARIHTCNVQAPTISQGVHGCFTRASDVVMPYLVGDDVRPTVSVTVFAASTLLDQPGELLARTTSNGVGHYELALDSGRYLLCTGGTQPVTGVCENITIDSGQVLRRNYASGDPPVTFP